MEAPDDLLKFLARPRLPPETDARMQRLMDRNTEGSLLTVAQVTLNFLAPPLSRYLKEAIAPRWLKNAGNLRVPGPASLAGMIANRV